MSTKKRIRKNRYKKQVSRKRFKNKKQSHLQLGLYLKIAAGICILGVMSLGLIFMHDFLTQCDYFRADNLQITGEKRLEQKEVLKTAGIKKGENTLSWNLSLIRTRLIGHPLISEAEITRVLPSGIIINITEHNTLAVLDLGRHFLINDKGVIFKERDKSDPKKLPIIKGLDYSDLNAPEKSQSVPLSAVMEVLLLKDKIDSSIPQLSIKQIIVDREIGLTLQTSGGIESILLGYGNYMAKYDKLKKVYSFLKKKRQLAEVDSLNLVNPGRIILKRSMILSSVKKQKEV